MEKNVKRLTEQYIRETMKIGEGFSVERIEKETTMNFKQAQTKALHDLKTEEQNLKSQMENLKKENFTLEISIKAWQTTREQKQNELTEAESKLNEVYNEIWSEREEFCTRADEFNNRFGILSKWWEEKMDKVFNPRERDEEMYLARVQELEKEIDNLQKEVENLEKEEEVKEDKSFNLDSKGQEESESKNTEEEYQATMRTIQYDEPIETVESPEKEAFKDSTSEIVKENPKKKKVRFSNEDVEVTIYNKEAEDLKTKFFSILDAETVRKANRIKNKQKQQFLSKVRKIT